MTAVDSWLARPGTRAEIDAARAHFRRYNPAAGGRTVDTVTEFQATIFALAIEVLAALEMYGGDEEAAPEETILGGFDPAEPDDDDKPWLRRQR